MLQGQVDVTDCQVDNLQHQVIDLEGKLVKWAALEAAFDHFTNEHWIPLQAIVLSVRKLDLLHLWFSLNFYFLMFLSQFPSMFLLLTYFNLFFSYLLTTQDT